MTNSSPWFFDGPNRNRWQMPFLNMVDLSSSQTVNDHFPKGKVQSVFRQFTLGRYLYPLCLQLANIRKKPWATMKGYLDVQALNKCCVTILGVMMMFFRHRN